MIIDKGKLEQIIEHCQKEYPGEACGILAGKNNTVEKIYKMKNISETPDKFYFMDPEEQLKVFKNIRNLDMEMQAIYHSHVNSAPYPSKSDMEMAFYPECLYLIISLKDMDNPCVRCFKIAGGRIEEDKIIITGGK